MDGCGDGGQDAVGWYVEGDGDGAAVGVDDGSYVLGAALGAEVSVGTSELYVGDGDGSRLGEDVDVGW